MQADQNHLGAFNRPDEDDITLEEIASFNLLSDKAITLGYLAPDPLHLTAKGAAVINTWLNDPQFPLPEGYGGTDEEHISMILMMVATGEGDPNG